MADEHQSLTRAAQGRKPKGYGAAVTSNGPSRRPTTSVVTHKIIKSDSLTSLAIKYNSTVSDIKRVNKLWNNESLSFRETIDIPIFTSELSTGIVGHSTVDAVESSDINVTLVSPATHASDVGSDVFLDNFGDISPSTRKDDVMTMKDSPSTLASNGATQNICIDSNDFFTRFDQSLSFLKKRVEDQTQFSESDISTQNPDYFLRPKSSHQNSRNGNSKESSSQRNSRSSIRSLVDDVKTTPEPVVKAKVERKLRKHQERQDELFSL
ncbi:lysM and putative peptidoglycan-binding domain-containing protein 1-like [Watersipora subatra]|uniref:lysM and putative peptidoglycan-binding domain-containing protein 1-like n=1 Tax=Watersipora subatra TaxID=2589382 RepID=UPI00355B2003